MKRLVVSLFFLLLGSQIAMAQGAKLQVIHNAADPAASSVDVYVNGSLLLDNFAFRAATPFVDVPAGVPVNVGVAPATSTSAADTLKNFTFTFTAGRTYTAIANGVLNTGAFAANPSAKSTFFTIFANDQSRMAARYPWFVDVRAFHGATDAPTVGIYVKGFLRQALGEAVSYGQFSPYRSLLPGKYTVEVTVNGGATVVASFTADLSALKGGAATVFASGFLTPASNQNGPAFGLYAALPNGTVVPLPSATSMYARLQVIHNAADPLAKEVDVYLNGSLLLDNFKFRAATPFVTVPSGVPLNIGIAPPTSASAADTLKNIVVTLEGGKRYIAVANGVLNPSNFDANPDAKPIGFQLLATDRAREKGVLSWLVDVAVLHGASDAPTVDVRLQALPWYPLYNDVSYGSFTDYRSLPAWIYALQVTPGDGSSVVATFAADLRGLKGKAALVFASGFLAPSNNQNGPAFGLFAALPNGTVVELPALAGAQIAAVPGLSSEVREFFGAEESQPREFTLGQNYPNPFNPTTSIAFTLPSEQFVSLKVYNLLGQVVADLVNEVRPAGEYSVAFNASNLPSGVYLYRLQAGSDIQTKKMTLMK